MQIECSNRSGSFFQPRVKPIAKEIIVGHEEGLIEIKDRLFGEPSSQLEIIPIVGMGGIGKTTLARYAFQDPSTAHHFDARAWATVSQNYSARIVLSTLFSSIDPSNNKKYECMDKELLVVHGHRYLKSRRYLIVMDDMWDTDVWDDVRMAFPDDCNGSRIIITTRDLSVASYVDLLEKPYTLQLMSVDQSWRLLKECVFGLENCPPELEKIGKHIAKKCKGLPLAIVVIAGLLSKLEKKQESWEKIARNVSETVNTSSDQQFYDILSVSYMHLPPHLRDCFLYTACFPEDYEISVSRLIRLWAAEGFLISDESKDMEELGYELLEDLARRSLVLIEKKRYDGKIKVVKIHDVLRDLCIRKSRDENFLCTINEFKGSFPQGIENSHRLSICSKVWGCIPKMECTTIYTIMFFSGHWAFKYWKDFNLLKVLDALSVPLKSWLVGLSNLIHLRRDTIETRPDVPESVSKLQNLQTLIMRPFEHFSFYAHLPVAIWRMPHLRHIIILNGFLPHPSTKALPLRNLQTLCCIKNFTCSERILELLPNLKKLGICYWASDLDETGWSKYDLYNMIHLHYLEMLSIRVYDSNNKSDMAKNLAFPVTLKRLTLCGCAIPWKEMTIIGSLPNLEKLKLKRNTCQGTIWETTEGEFRELKVLLIETTDLHQWITESSHFPKLEHLTLCECNDLKEIPYDIGEIPTLQLIEVDAQNFSLVLSAQLIQSEQRSLGNDIEVSFLETPGWNYFNHRIQDPWQKILWNASESKNSRYLSEVVNVSRDTTCFPEGTIDLHSHRVKVCSNINTHMPKQTMLLFKNWAFNFWISFKFLTEVIVSRATFRSSSSISSIRHIGELIHLRYLVLSFEATKRTHSLVSESLYQLQNLRILILILDGYTPYSVWGTPKLRHLIVMDGSIPDDAANENSPLENLRVLSRTQDFIPNLEKLKNVYRYWGTYKTRWSENGLKNMVHLHKLLDLSLHAETHPDLKNDLLSENISFPVTLKKLALSRCRFPWKDMRMIGSLPHLQDLKLTRYACVGTEWRTSEGEFCQLRMLLIDGTDLHEWILHASSFPRLQHLILYECGSLREIPNGIGDIPTLSWIEVDIRDLFVVESAKQIQEEQSFGCLQLFLLSSRSWGR